MAKSSSQQISEEIPGKYIDGTNADGNRLFDGKARQTTPRGEVCREDMGKQRETLGDYIR